MPDIKTKEEIWEQETNNDDDIGWTGSAMSAMNIWAKQECISFLDYVMSHQYRELEGGATSNELYSLYLEQSKQK